MLMRAATSTLLVIDIQERLCPALPEAQALVEHSAWLVQVAQRLAVPVLVTEQYPKGLGSTVAALQEHLQGAAVVEKLSFSAAADDALFAQPGGERQQFVVCGAETHVCVLQTVFDLLARGRQVFVVEEAVASRTVRQQGVGAGAHAAGRSDDRVAGNGRLRMAAARRNRAVSRPEQDVHSLKVRSAMHGPTQPVRSSLPLRRPAFQLLRSVLTAGAAHRSPWA